MPESLSIWLDAVRRTPVLAATLARRRLWSRSSHFGLRCALSALPAATSAGVPLVMESVGPGFSGFHEALSGAHDSEVEDLLERVRFCEAGVTTLYAAHDSAGAPIYAQWLIRATEQERLHALTGNLFPRLQPDEVLLEGAYTFSNFRKLGSMADGMHQLLEIARREGATSAITYVTFDNVPSLRGCARVGFELDQTRVGTRRLGLRRIARREPIQPETLIWERLTTGARPLGQSVA
jgi:hypothetical protein